MKLLGVYYIVFCKHCEYLCLLFIDLPVKDADTGPQLEINLQQITQYNTNAGF